VFGELAAGSAAIGAGDVVLIAFSWKSRTVLAGVAGVVGIVLIGFAITSGLTSRAAEAALVGALVFLIVGAALHRLGQALERLLDVDPDDKS